MCTSLWLDFVRSLIEQTVLTLGYVGIGVLMLIENAFPPLPSELVIPFAGFLIREGQLSFVGVLLASTLGSVLGTSLIYLLGRSLGETRLRQFVGRWGYLLWFDKRKFDLALARFSRHEGAILFWARLVPGLRSFISFPAGINQTPLWRFWLYSTLGSAVWNAALLGLGVWLGSNWTQVLLLVDRYEAALLMLALGLGGFAVFRRYRRHTSGLSQPLK